MTDTWTIEFQKLAERYVDMWNATDARARRQAIEQLCAVDVRYTDPLGDAAGRDELAEAISGVHQQFPDFAFTLGGPVDGHHDQARFTWELGLAGAPAPIAGFDVVTVNEQGRLTRVLGFLDRVPSA